MNLFVPSSKSTPCSAVILITLLSSTSSFLLNPTSSYYSTAPSTTKLFISSWGTKGPPSRRREVDPDPAEKVVAYLKEPQPVPSRPNLDGTVLVSGWVDSEERTDQGVFDLLNEVDDGAFRFEKIVAFVDDAKFAKKRLISRSARYTGLLDKLDFIQASEKRELPTVEQLNDVKSWVANAADGGLDRIREIAQRAGEAPSTLQNLSILVTNGQDITDLTEINNTAEMLKKTCDEKDIAYTLVVVGALNEKPEGSTPYAISDFGLVSSDESNDEDDNTDIKNEDATILLPSNATYSRDESLRLVTELMGMVTGKNRALVFQEVLNVNATEFKLIRGLREGGYSRNQEIDHMITNGTKPYEKACEDYKIRRPVKYTDWDEFLEEERVKENKRKKERDEKLIQDIVEKKKQDIENMASEYAKREYYIKSMSGDITLSEEEYVKSVWDTAMSEADVKYNMLTDGTKNVDTELADFKRTQEKKKQVMLERAKATLQELIEEDEREVADAEDDDDDDNNDD